MTQIVLKNLASFLDAPDADTRLSVILIYGEEALCKTALNQLLDYLLPGDARQNSFEALEGTPGNIAEAVEKAQTFALLGGAKVVALLDTTVFYADADVVPLLTKARSAAESGNMAKAAETVLLAMAHQELQLEALDRENIPRLFDLKTARQGWELWLPAVIDYCREKKMRVPERRDHAQILRRSVERGFPKGNHLVLTTDKINRRHGLFKAVDAQGLVVNCAVPGGGT